MMPGDLKAEHVAGPVAVLHDDFYLDETALRRAVPDTIQSPRTCTATSSNPNPTIHDHMASWVSMLITPNVASRATA